jgi:hypothetical protein
MENSLVIDQEVKNYAIRHGYIAGLLYNNRLYFGYVNPTKKQKEQYEINRRWILDVLR